METSYDKKIKLDQLLRKYQVQPVGFGYIDCITKKENVLGFVEDLSLLGIRITGITWWCYCKPEANPGIGCPHGGGGPRSRYFDGWFSEMYQYMPTDIRSNDEVVPYIFEIWPGDENYLPCLIPAFCLEVPEDWRSKDVKAHDNVDFVQDVAEGI